MNKLTPLIFVCLTLGGIGLLIYHLTNETSDYKDYLSSALIIVANIGMYIAIKKSEKWGKDDDSK